MVRWRLPRTTAAVCVSAVVASALVGAAPPPAGAATEGGEALGRLRDGGGGGAIGGRAAATSASTAAEHFESALARLQETCSSLFESRPEDLAAQSSAVELLARCRQLAVAGLWVPRGGRSGAAAAGAGRLGEATASPTEASLGRTVVDEVLLRRRLSPDLISREWYLDADSYYIMFVVMSVGVLTVVVVLHELLFWRTTLLGRVKKGVTGLQARISERMSFRTRTLSEAAKHGAVKETPVEVHKNFAAFWDVVHAHFQQYSKVWQDRELHPQIFASDADTVEFSMLNFPAKEADEFADITVTRHGSCQGPLTVKLRTRDGRGADNPVGFKARANFDYMPLPPDFSVTFQDGEMTKSFRVTLKQTDGVWLPTRWFYVQLMSTEGATSTVMAGPAINTTDAEPPAEEERLVGGPTVRVFILQDDAFPPGMPLEQLGVENDLKCLLYYYVHRIKVRGSRFWKALAGYCYIPIHAVVVTPLIQSYMIDFGAHPDEDGGYRWIIVLVAVQFVSTILLRWGDVLVTRNRGRTGGTRQELRRQLLSKVLMMDHEEQYCYPGGRWFHAALLDVDIIVRDGYWQMFVMIQSVFALMLCLGVLVWKALYKASRAGRSIEVQNFIPAFLLLSMIPLVLVSILTRRRHAAFCVEQRLQKEEVWVETIAWITSHAKNLFVFSQREFSFIQSMFMDQNKDFLKWHQLARDYLNDSTWIAKWLGGLSYVAILCWASFRLFESRCDATALDFSAGDCVILLQVFSKCGSYLGKVSTSFVSMQKGAVALRRVANMLNLKEKQCLHDVIDGKTTRDGSRSHIIMKNVVLKLPDQPLKLGPVDPITMRSSVQRLEVPLGKIICIVGSNESRRLSVMTMMAGMLRPTRGSVHVPAREWSILLPFETVGLPGCTCKQDLFMAGVHAEQIDSVAKNFHLQPEESHSCMSPGQSATHALLRAMIRDPTILMAVRPAAAQPVELRRKVMMALVLWQMGGGWRVINECLTKTEDEVSLVEVQPQLENHRRTLIIAEGRIPDFIPVHLIHVVNVDEYFEPDEHIMGSEFLHEPMTPDDMSDDGSNNREFHGAVPVGGTVHGSLGNAASAWVTSFQL